MPHEDYTSAEKEKIYPLKFAQILEALQRLHPFIKLQFFRREPVITNTSDWISADVEINSSWIGSEELTTSIPPQ